MKSRLGRLHIGSAIGSALLLIIAIITTRITGEQSAASNVVSTMAFISIGATALGTMAYLRLANKRMMARGQFGFVLVIIIMTVLVIGFGHPDGF